MALIGRYDIVADGSDNFATRFLVNDACYFAGKTLVSAAVTEFEGQLATYKAHEAGLSLLSLPVPRAPAAGHGALLFGDRGAGRRGGRDGVAAGAGSAEGDYRRRRPAWPGKLLIYEALTAALPHRPLQPRPRLPAVRQQPTIIRDLTPG